MLRATVIARRTPMIHFRYGSNAGTTGGAAASAGAATSAAPTRVVLESVFDLPAHLRPLGISPEESDAIRYGGCKGYELKVKGKK